MGRELLGQVEQLGHVGAGAHDAGHGARGGPLPEAVALDRGGVLAGLLELGDDGDPAVAGEEVGLAVAVARVELDVLGAAVVALRAGADLDGGLTRHL